MSESMVVSCTCGAKLKARPELAGKKTRCPQCGQSVRVPVPVAAQDAGEPSTGPAPLDLLNELTESRTSKPPPGVIVSVPDDDDLYGLAEGDHIPIESLKTPGEVSAVEAAGYAVNEQVARARRRQSSQKDVIQGPKRAFWQDLGYAFVYPVSSVENAVTTGVLMLFVLAAIFCRFAGAYGLMGRLAIFGWVAAACMTVVQETTVGSDDMPGVKMEGGWVDDILLPAFKYVVTYLLAMVPTILYAVACNMGFIDDRRGVILIMWLGLGVFLWPLIMLLGSLGEWRILAQPHLIVLTIAQTIVPYLFIWLVLLLSQAFWIAFNFGPLLNMYGIDVTKWMPTAFSMEWLVFLGASELALTYLTLVSMRLIGLYYLHFKHRFAFKLE